jgi:hypothetical protein
MDGILPTGMNGYFMAIPFSLESDSALNAVKKQNLTFT